MLNIALGGLAFVAGCVGIVLPVVPTVPFYLLASFFWAKGSPKLEKKLKSGKLYKKYAEGFAEYRSMSLLGEIILLTFISAVVISVCLIFDGNIVVAVIMPVLESVRFSYFFLCVKTVSAERLAAVKAKGRQQ